MKYSNGVLAQIGDKVFYYDYNNNFRTGTVKRIGSGELDNLLDIEISGVEFSCYSHCLTPLEERGFKQGDRVQVSNRDINTYGLTGVVHRVQSQRITVDVDTPWAGAKTRRLYYNAKSLKNLVADVDFKPSVAEPVVNNQLVGVFWGSKTNSFEDARIVWSGHGETREEINDALLESDTDFYPHLWVKYIGSGELEKLKYKIERA